MTTLGTRIRELRKGRGLRQAQLAEALGLSDHTFVSKIENDKAALSGAQLAKLADLFGVTADDLLRRSREKTTDALETEPLHTRRNVLSIEELDVRANGGPGLLHDVHEAEKVVNRWQMPTNIVQAQTTAGSVNLKIITVYGDSMAPDFLPGERVLVDTSDRKPSPPGVFVIWDGVGLVIKRLELIPPSSGDDRLMVRLIPRNRDEYQAYERPLTDVTINGRVIGKWQWT